ncbi:MAG TPA: choice-of-anchor tandem repeat GloVer-containing protein [Candidatus Binatia bacterium]|nr:choice-of-anchor tandem repeat GloVer-containing protein [Candidatus Binatia bacterium]
MRYKLTFVAVLALLASSAFAANSQPTAVYTFICNGNAFERIGGCPEGGRPDSLIQASDGNFYGAAQDSMEGSSSPTGGTVFSVTAAGKFTRLHVFAPGPNKTYATGNLPGNIVQGPDGKLYGDTLFGGIDGCNGYCGYGLLYRINTDGSDFQIVHKFCSEANCADGNAGYFMSVGTDGNIYGTTYYGGTNSAGTIFQIVPSTGAYKVVVNFDFSTTGENPGALVSGPDGTFYGLTASSSGEVLFHYNESTGVLSTALLNFPLFNGLPSHGGDLTLGPNGNFYGLYGVYGVSGEGVFEVDVDGSNLQLFSFYTTQDGAGEPDGLLLASDGNFWMADIVGNSYGNIITLSPADGSLIQTLKPFNSKAAVGAYPMVILQAKDGTLWGTTDSFGNATTGHFGDGTVFSLNAGLPPR